MKSGDCGRSSKQPELAGSTTSGAVGAISGTCGSCGLGMTTLSRVCGHQLEAVLQAHPSRNQAGTIAVADTHGCHSSNQGPTQIVSYEFQSVRHSWIFGYNPKVHHSTHNTQYLAEEYEELHQREAVQQLRLCIYYGTT